MLRILLDPFMMIDLTRFIEMYGGDFKFYVDNDSFYTEVI